MLHKPKGAGRYLTTFGPCLVKEGENKVRPKEIWMRKRFEAGFKTKVALEAFRGEKMLSQLSAE